MTLMITGIIIVVAILLSKECSGHGRLMEPPARNSMWRFGYPNPVNYNDNELFCGGFQTFMAFGARCGVCGDSMGLKNPRPHETGGIFGNSVISKVYKQGQNISISVELTANHRGYFEFRLCPAFSRFEEVSQECLDSNLLKIYGNDGELSTKFPVSAGRRGNFEITALLPSDLVCSRCVFQWKYTAGNNWGVCEDGTEGLGCGAQETFVNCADIQIVDLLSNKIFEMAQHWTSPKAVMVVDESNPFGPKIPLVVREQVCVSTTKYSSILGMDSWCQHNCLRYPPNCPQSSCQCIHDCVAIGSFSREQDADAKCLDACLTFPPKNCNPQKCACWSKGGARILLPSGADGV